MSGGHPVTWQEYAEDDTLVPPLAKLATCRWCVGVWVGLGVAAARTVAPRAWRPAGLALAVASASVLVARLEDPADDT